MILKLKGTVKILQTRRPSSLFDASKSDRFFSVQHFLLILLISNVIEERNHANVKIHPNAHAREIPNIDIHDD